MSILKSKKWAEIKAILAGADYCIAGGYARDTFFGREPKDMDVGVFNADATEILDIVGLLEAYDLIVESYINEDDLMQAHYEGNHIAGIVTCVGGIDLIFCNEEVSTAEEWISTFDYNLNQFALEDFGYASEAKFCGYDFGTLQFNNTNTNRINKAVQRREKMLNLSKEVNWCISDYVRDMDVEKEILEFRSES